MKKFLLVVFAAVLVLSVFAGCGNNNNNENNAAESPSASPAESPAATEAPAAGADIEGEITFLHNRTDINDTVFKEQYIPKFNEKYPNIKVNLEAITDYEGQVKIRLNTTDYGDVLYIPAAITPQDLPNFFEPLGSYDELSQKYLFANEQMFEGTTYGIPTMVTANGMVYNKAVFAAAGVTSVPKSPEEFLDAMQKIKDNTDAVPYYTNYAAGWPLDQWEANRGAVAGDPKYVNYTMVHSDDPFAEGKPHYVIYKLMYDLAKNGLIEEDPTTTDWETSKTMLGEGKIGAMTLGSWSISQMQGAAANAADIGYMPFPSNKDGKVYATSGGDWKIAVNKNSKNKEAALAWLYWFVEESGYAASQGAISTIKGQPMPETLAAFDELGVELIADEPAPTEENGLWNQIDQESEIGFWSQNFKQRIIEAGIGNRDETIEDIFAELNKKWNDARKTLGVE